MRSFIVTFVEEGKVRSRQVIAVNSAAARANIEQIQGVVIVRVSEVCDGCEGAISEGYDSPLNGDSRYCELCTALDAFSQADLPAIVVLHEGAL